MNNFNTRNMNEFETVFRIDPYVVQTLMSVLGTRLLVETTGSTYSGTLEDVKPDHIVLKEMQPERVVFIRIAQIVSLIPLK